MVEGLFEYGNLIKNFTILFNNSYFYTEKDERFFPQF